MMARKIIKTPRPPFKLGNRVHVDGDAGGDYKGKVTKILPALTKSASAYDDTPVTKPGVEVKVDWWDGSAIDYDMVIEAWNDETRKEAANV